MSAARPSNSSSDVPWRPDENCPCGSGREFQFCCEVAGRLPFVDVMKTQPVGPRTGFSHPGCYLGSTSNCSEKISKEHFISEAILKQFAGGLLVSGLPWHDQGESRKYSTNSLVSRVLCSRHNNSLAPLDSAASHFFAQMRLAMQHVTKKSMLRRSAFFLASGNGLEAWGVKTLLGLFHSRIASTNGQCLADSFTLNEPLATKVLEGAQLPKPLGMFVSFHQTSRVTDAISVAPLTDPSSHKLVGLMVEMIGVMFEFLIDTQGANPKFFEELHFYRPNIIDLEGPRRTSRVFLSWPSVGESGKRVSLKITTMSSSGS